MNSISLELPGFTWWWIPLALALAGLLFFAFKNSPIGKSHKFGKVLLTLRSLIFILLAGLILRPEIHWTSVRKKAPSVLIWIDNSLSIANQNNFSSDSLLIAVQKFSDNLNSKGIRPRFYSFDDKIQPVTGKLKNFRFDGVATDIAQVLDNIITKSGDENIVGAILISDGVITRGEDPTFMNFKPAFPVYTVGIGDSSRVMDPAVTRIDLPQSTNVGDTVTISAEIIPSGNGEPLTVMLKSNDQILRRINLPSQIQALKKTVDFKIVPEKSGEQTISVEIAAAQDKNPYNNLRISTIKVLESETRILIISGPANFEARFLTNSLRGLKNMVVQNITENNDNWLPMKFPETLAKQWDLLVLIGYPTTHSKPAELISLRQKIINSKLPVILFINGYPDLRQIEKLFGWNPVAEYTLNKNIEEITVNCSHDGLNHPIIRNFRNSDFPAEIWTTLPPIGMPFKKIRLTESFQTIVESSDISGNPVISVNPEINKRMAVCAGVDFWRWSFLTQDVGRMNLYDELFQGMTKWLADTLGSSPIQFSVDKKTYLTGETIEITGLLRDLKGDLVKKARMKAELYCNKEMIATGGLIWDGKSYSGSLPVKNAGDGLVRVTALQEEKPIGVREQPVVIVDRPVELMEVRQDADLLRSIALKSDGKKVSLEHLSEMTGQFNTSQKIIRSGHLLKLMQWKWSLIFMVILLVAEWSIRRFHGYQ